LLASSLPQAGQRRVWGISIVREMGVDRSAINLRAGTASHKTTRHHPRRRRIRRKATSFAMSCVSFVIFAVFSRRYKGRAQGAARGGGPCRRSSTCWP
jgi:hypothetical protein